MTRSRRCGMLPRRPSSLAGWPCGSACCWRPKRRGRSELPASVETPLGPAPGRRINRDVVVVPSCVRAWGCWTRSSSWSPPRGWRHRPPARRADRGRVAVLLEAAGGFDPSFVLMIDPMLATGGSAASELDLLRRRGPATAHGLIVAAPEGISFVEQRHPDVTIYTPVVDRGSTTRSSSSRPRRFRRPAVRHALNGPALRRLLCGAEPPRYPG